MPWRCTSACRPEGGNLHGVTPTPLSWLLHGDSLSPVRGPWMGVRIPQHKVAADSGWGSISAGGSVPVAATTVDSMMAFQAPLAFLGIAVPTANSRTNQDRQTGLPNDNSARLMLYGQLNVPGPEGLTSNEASTTANVLTLTAAITCPEGHEHRTHGSLDMRCSFSCSTFTVALPGLVLRCLPAPTQASVLHFSARSAFGWTHGA